MHMKHRIITTGVELIGDCVLIVGACTNHTHIMFCFSPFKFSKPSCTFNQIIESNLIHVHFNIKKLMATKLACNMIVCRL
jgi:hypothetical protein